MALFSFGRLRVKLVFLVLIAVIPALILTFYSGLEQRRQTRLHALGDALELAKKISDDQERLIERTHQLLVDLAKMDQALECQSSGYSPFLAGLLKEYPFYTNLGMTGPDGQVICSALPMKQPINLADREWFIRILRARKFTVSEYLIGRITGKPSIVLSYPIFAGTDHLKAVVFAGLDLTWLYQIAAKAKIPPGSMVRVFDLKGTILASYPDPEKWVGQSMSDTPIVKTILTRQGEGTVEIAGIDGVLRLFAFTPLSDRKEVGAYVAVGIPSTVAFAETNRILFRNLALLVLVAILALVATWWFGGFFIMGPVNRLLNTTKRLADGDLTIRTGSSYPPGEIGQLAHSFDQMAESLQHREAERKYAEEVLRESEERSQSLIETSPDVIVLIDFSGKIIVINEAALTTYGYESRDELIGRSVLDFVIPEDRPRVLPEISKVLEVKTLRNLEYTSLKKDGSTFSIEVSASLILDAQQKPTSIAIMIRDITERKRVEEKTRRLATVVKDSNDAITIQDFEGRIIAWNRGAELMYGFSEEEALQMNIGRLTSPDKEAEQKEFTRRLIAGEAITSLETQRVAKDGRILDIWMTVTKLVDDTGKPIGIASTERDITERKRAEEALRKSEERFRELYDRAPVGYHETDINGHITNVNFTELEMLGFSLEEMLGQPVWKFIVEEELSQQGVLAKLAGRIPPAQGIERTYRRKDGTTFPAIIEDRLLQDSEGKIIGIRSTVQDITDRKRGEEEKKVLEDQLRQAQKVEAIGRLAGGIAHDFNNLLTIIKGNSQLSLMEIKKGDPLRENIEEVEKAADRAAALTRQLLAFSRRQVLEMRVLDLNTILRDLEKMLHRVIGEDMGLVTLLAENLGTVKADPGQIEQVVMNLAVNARDAMPKGGKLTIETTNVDLDENYARNHVAVTPGRYVMLSVSDTGVGMTSEVKERIFEPFFTTKEQGKGTGLGLSTVYGIVKQSGGNIWIYSEPGQGTTFKIYLPRVDEPLEEAGERVVQKELPGGGETILVVEDEEKVRQVTVQILTKNGYTVLEASHGDEAKQICEQHGGPIHLIVTDVVLPGMNGRELAESLVSRYPGAKVLYMSGYTDNAIVHHGVLEKGLSFLQKPFNLEDLLKKVREVLEK